MPEKDRYLRGLFTWFGFNQVPIYFDLEPRFAGETKHALSKMIGLALSSIFSFSAKPLKWATYKGVVVIALSILGILYGIFLRLFTESWVPGWILMFVANLFFGGLQLIFLRLVGEYIGRLYGEA